MGEFLVLYNMGSNCKKVKGCDGMAEVEVIRAADGPVARRRDIEGKGVRLDRIRVAAYVRVSTDGEEQLASFESQLKYYQEKIGANKEWAMVGIYQDEAITGTKTSKREGFQKMINDCMNGEIDLILTKSISRFSRNLVDTMQYVRLLKEKGVRIIFEKENIDTMSMQSEMMLALLGTLAQNEVESLSANVKMGIKMKMKRGEMMGFNGCLGYDYHKEDKSITINHEEAETVRLIFDLYLQGYGAYTIARRLKEMGRLNKKGVVSWTDSGVRGIIRNEKYKGDLLLEKSFTVDPISKRRIENFGEEEQYYIKDHHEPIVSPEIWDMAQEIRTKRSYNHPKQYGDKREKYTRKYALSSMCECGFCGTKLTRRMLHSSSKYATPSWYCRTAANKGKENCPNSKTVHELIIQNAFLEMYRLLAQNFEDVLESVIGTVRSVAEDDSGRDRLEKAEKSLYNYENRRKKLTDLLIEDQITKEAYDEKYEDLSGKIAKAKEDVRKLRAGMEEKKDIGKRMDAIRKQLQGGDVLDEFDRMVFESIVDKVIVGETEPDGRIDPYKLTFVLKGNGKRVMSVANKK